MTYSLMHFKLLRGHGATSPKNIILVQFPSSECHAPSDPRRYDVISSLAQFSPLTRISACFLLHLAQRAARLHAILESSFFFLIFISNDNVINCLPGVFSGLREIIRRERFVALYKGNFAQMVRIFPYAATQYTSFEFYKKVCFLISFTIQFFREEAQLLAHFCVIFQVFQPSTHAQQPNQL